MREPGSLARRMQCSMFRWGCDRVNYIKVEKHESGGYGRRSRCRGGRVYRIYWTEADRCGRASRRDAGGAVGDRA